MNINANELMLINNRMNLKKMNAKNTPAPTSEPTTTAPEASFRGLEQQGMNNIAFGKVDFSKVAKTPHFNTLGNKIKTLFVAGSILTGSLLATSCEKNEMNQVMNVDMDALIEALTKALVDPITENQERTNELLLRLIELVEKNNTISQENNDLIYKVIGWLQKLDQNDQEGYKVLNAILEKIEYSIAHNEKMDAATIALLEKIAANQEKFGKEHTDLLLQLIEKADTIDATLKTEIGVVVEKMDTMGEDQKALLYKILEEIVANNRLTAANANMLSIVIRQLGTLDKNDKAEMAILNQIWIAIQDAIKNEKDMDAKEQALLKAILENIQNFKEENAQNIMLLIESVKNLDASVAHAFAKLFEKMDNMTDEGRKVFNEILNQVINGNNSIEKNNQLLAVVIEALGKIDQNKDPEMFEMLKNIWETLQAHMKQDAAMDEKTHSLLHAILSNVQNFNKETVILLKELIERADKFGPEIIDLLNKIVNNQDKLGKDGKEATNKILEAINKNTEVAKGTYNLVAKLLANVDKLGDKGDAILKAIADISTGENVDLSKIEAMLADLLAQEKANGEVLESADAKASLTLVVLEGIKKAIKDGDEATLAKLQEVIDKMPENCKCDADLKVIIEKLQNILDKLAQGNNEGVEGDLNDLEKEFS